MVSFELNSKIELVTADDEKTYGLIYDVVDDKLHVSIVSDEKQLKLLHVGDMVSGIVFTDLSGIAFDATVSRRIIGDFPIYELSEITNYKKIQRRQDVRVPCLLDVLYTDEQNLLSLEKSRLEHLDKDEFKKYFKSGIIADLSGGGLKLTTNDRFDKGNILVLKLDLEKNHMFTKGQVLHKDIKVTSRSSIYNYGIKFIDLSEQEKDEIIRFLFVLMRRNKLK